MSTFFGSVTSLDIIMPHGVHMTSGMQPFEFHWSAPDGVHFTDYSLCASDSKGVRRFDRKLAGPQLLLDQLPDLSMCKELWEEFRQYRARTSPRPMLAEAYASIAFEHMIGVRSAFTLSLKPRERRGCLELCYKGSAGTYLWETFWDVSDMLPYFSFNSDIIDWSADSYGVTQPQAQAA